MGIFLFLLIGLLVVWYIHAFLVLIKFEMEWVNKLLWGQFILFIPFIGSTTFLIWHIFEVKKLRKELAAEKDNNKIE